MKNSKSSLYNDLKRQILTMELHPDEALGEVAISERYGLSRTPVREVFQRLAGDGYVGIRENRGARVVPMNHSTMRSFFLVAPMIFAAIGRLAVQNFKLRQLVDLKETQQRFRDAALLHDVQVMVEQKNRFHAIMGEMAGNQYLELSLNRLLIDLARIGHSLFRPADQDAGRCFQSSADQHDSFIAAIEGRDEGAVVELVFQHLELSRQNMEKFTPTAMRADLPI
ncbi:GntR family transcriptional regulator [Pseudomonas sp. BF-RE-26]|uniref:GntR family transcriptional regulator n=1 Tax=Pseudomonas sp. BF-RE-26 TaxID=2832396 RepID=UPI001CC14B45|nr:GntR family transcriptional regulator [Pseudomonas sp. BF-RE-26]